MTLRLEFRDTVSLPNGTHLVFIVSIMNQKWREGNKIPPQRLRGQGAFEDARFTNGHFLAFVEKRRMDCKNRIIKLRESTGLNRKDFCKLVHIPYRTMTEWELDNRHAPDYVLWLLEYYIRNEGLMVKGRNEGGGDSEKETT